MNAIRDLLANRQKRQAPKIPAQRGRPDRIPESAVQREFDTPGPLEPGMVFAFRSEADPREASAVRPTMDDSEREEFYRALQEESDAADLCYTEQSL